VPLEMTEGNYSNVGHRGPVYKGLGVMNPCDLSRFVTATTAQCVLCIFDVTKVNRPRVKVPEHTHSTKLEAGTWDW
jgi:hypothetical protein